MANPKLKRKQLSLSQYEEHKAKQNRPKIFSGLPKIVLLILAIPMIIFIGLLLGYILYIRQVSAH